MIIKAFSLLPQTFLCLHVSHPNKLKNRSHLNEWPSCRRECSSFLRSNTDAPLCLLKFFRVLSVTEPAHRESDLLLDPVKPVCCAAKWQREHQDIVAREVNVIRANNTLWSSTVNKQEKWWALLPVEEDGEHDTLNLINYSGNAIICFLCSHTPPTLHADVFNIQCGALFQCFSVKCFQAQVRLSPSP